MTKALILVAALFVLATNNPAIAEIKKITPNKDSCLAYTTAFDNPDMPLNPILTAWAIGFFSGVAQGTGIDYLRNDDLTSLTLRLINTCRSQPDKLLSLAAEELSRSLITEQGPMPTRQ